MSRSIAAATLLFAVTLALAAGPTALANRDEERAAGRALRRSPVVDVFDRSRDAVVNISSTETVSVRTQSPFGSMLDDFFDMPDRGRPRTYTRGSVGSGFVIHADGYIVTNAHVVARTTEQKVTFSDGREYDARIIAADADRDLAVLKVESDSPLPILPLGRSDDLMVGETVIAIGNPLGYENTVTAGVVSAVERSVQISENLAFEGLIQTDASINPGNSGGPLLNVLGELIGINSAIRGDAQNIGFAIPVDHLRAVLPEMLDVERRYRVRSGLRLDTIEEPEVVTVDERSPAAQAGIRPGDLLLAIDGRPVREGIDFDIAMINRQPGDRLRLRLDREGREVSAVLTLADRPKPDGRLLAARRLGMEVAPISRRTAEQLRLRRQLLRVEAVEPAGPADEAGVLSGDIILALGRRYVDDLDEIGQLLEGADEGGVVEIEIFRVEPRRKSKRRGPIEIR